MHINYLKQVIKFIHKLHYIADDTNLLHFSKSVYKLDKCVYRDLKNLVNWLNAKNIYLNVKSDGVSNFYTPKENIR